jgi:transcriptional regulator with XRE-family HTH domain
MLSLFIASVNQPMPIQKSNLDNSTKALGERVRDLRVSRTGLSQEHFADKVGLNRIALGRIEKGESNATFTTIRKICLGLEITLSEFFDGFEDTMKEMEASET